MPVPESAEMPATGRAALPGVDAVLRFSGTAAVVDRFGRAALVAAVRERLGAVRAAIGDDEGAPDAGWFLAAAVADLESLRAGAVERVINATGVILHTNLGRAPLSGEAVRAVVAASGYSTIELDRANGGRGSRTAHAAMLAARLTGAESAHLVNNGAAALLLAVAALSAGRTVIISRGELIEIGGSFRLPEIIAAAGAELREVGTTNRTRISDYARAIDGRTGVILKVHRSNFRMVGFTEDAGLADLVALGRTHGVPTMFDAGSGLIDAPYAPALGDEPPVRDAVASGVDLVLFSGDKLLGGPQAGLIVGHADPVAVCRRSPLARALRIDKLQVAALEATLAAHLLDNASAALPAVEMLQRPIVELKKRARTLVQRSLERENQAPKLRALSLVGAVGGGASPDVQLESFGVAIVTHDPDRLCLLLRSQSPPVVARISEGQVILDLRTVAPEEDEELLRAILQATNQLEGQYAPRAGRVG